MAKYFPKLCGFVFVFALVLIFQTAGSARNVSRVVVIKVDGLSGDFVDRWVNQIDPKTGRSQLPWFQEVFYRNGTRLANFYVRGISLSAPSWSLIDTGQHLQIKNNIEYDRFTSLTYNYLNFFSFYVEAALDKRADMPAPEVLDGLQLPLLSDAFPKNERYASPQLMQREPNWDHMGASFANFYPRKPTQFINEWIIGFNYYDVPFIQAEDDIVTKLHTRPQINYFDFFSSGFDHISHINRDEQSRLAELQKMDRTIGRIWTSIQSTDRADETVMFIVSDHGINTDSKVYSQTFNLVSLLGSSAGGGHHVTTKRRVMANYSIKSALPFDLVYSNPSGDSFYLKGRSGDYPTALIDVDGNERSSMQLRNNDLNLLQILLQQMKNKKVAKDVRRSAVDTFFGIIDRRRKDWKLTVSQLGEELAALRRSMGIKRQRIEELKRSVAEKGSDADPEEVIRESAAYARSVRELKEYGEYLATLNNLLGLDPKDFRPDKVKIEDFIGRKIMGSSNSVYDLQNYVVGPSENGLVLNSAGNLDLEKSFRRVDYSRFFVEQRVRNNVQEGIGNQPIDFFVSTFPFDQISHALPDDMKSDSEVVWVSAGPEKQALVLSRTDGDGKQLLRYVPISNLRQSSPGGPITFEFEDWAAGFPLELFEDPELGISSGDRASWLSRWHTENEWLRVIHKTAHSNGLISLNEQFVQHEFDPPNGSSGDRSEDDRLIERFRNRQRRLAQPELMIFSKDHWNFDVQNFNSGGNHGSFLRISTNSLFMMAGGANTGIPRGLKIEEPYDGLSFVPTLLRLMGRINEKGEPDEDLRNRGFGRFPGPIIPEVISEERQLENVGAR